MIYRPYADIEKSVKCLSEYDLYYFGRLKCSLLIKSILAGLELIEFHTDELNTPVGRLYWNNGNPYLNDLVYYYNSAEELWLNAGGAGSKFITEEEEQIMLDCDFIENEYEWTEEHANIHKLLLLKWDRAWYKRKFMEIKHLSILDTSPFDSKGRPRKVVNEKIKEICRIYENKEI